MKIGQLSQSSGLSTHTLRYYEKMGLLQKPNKDHSGHRIYDAQEVELINWVTCLKKSGMPLASIKAYAQAFRTQENNQLEVLLSQHLKKLKSQQADLKHYIVVTELKLEKLEKIQKQKDA